MKDVDIKEVKRKLEVDALKILKFMEQNGIVGYPTKTTCMMLNRNE